MSAEFLLCSTYKPHLGFLLNFASGLLWQRSGRPILLVAQESKLCSGESKISKLLTIACVQAIGHSFFRFILYLMHELVGMMSHHPIFFVGLGSKIKGAIVILSQGVKIMLWGVKNIKNFDL